MLPCGKPQPGSVCDQAGTCAAHPRAVDVVTLQEGPACFSVPVKALCPGALCAEGCAYVCCFSMLLEKPQQFTHGSVFCVCVRVLALGWAMITNLTLGRICNKPDEHRVNRDRSQSPPSFVIKKPCTLHTLNKGEIFHCLKPVIKILLHPKSLPITSTPQTSVFRLEMA